MPNLWCYAYDYKCNRYSLVVLTVAVQQLHVTSYKNFTFLNTLAPAWHGFGDFRKKKLLNTHGFAREFIWSDMLYTPGKSLKKRSKSSSLHSKKIFLLGDTGWL